MMTIGEFALSTGLSVKALRFYDERGLSRRPTSTPIRVTVATARRSCAPPPPSASCGRQV